jgi:Arc/MetJ family transcription regulator
MRTNIDIDDQLMAKALKATGLKTKKAAVEEALRTVIRLRQQRTILDLPGKVRWVGNLDEMRQSRFQQSCFKSSSTSPRCGLQYPPLHFGRRPHSL